MADPTPYILFPGTAREALSFYAEVFGGETQLNTLAEMNRTDGPGDAIAHGYPDRRPCVAVRRRRRERAGVPRRGPDVRPARYGRPGDAAGSGSRGSAEGGQVVDDLQLRPWGAHDGVVVDRYGLKWLIGFEGDQS
jgi:PhnB protein